jgi:TetR/AcrR family transcriptional repressor of nem operon
MNTRRQPFLFMSGAEILEPFHLARCIRHRHAARSRQQEMSKGATKMVRMLQRAAPKAEARLEKEINHYLSQGHRSDIESGCPVAGFSGDTPRLNVEARSQFAVGLDDLITILAGLIAEAPTNPGKLDRRTLREQAISLCSQMVGALVLSRAVAEPTPALANEVLESSRRDLLAQFRKS